MPKRKPQLNAQVLEEASSWFVDFNDDAVDAAGREEFNMWIRRSPEHVQAYLQVAALWEDAGALNKQAAADVERLVTRARAERNVFELASFAPSKADRASSGKRSLAIAASVFLAVGIGVSAWYATHRVPTYSTETGEQRSVKLEDGSSVVVNSRSRLKAKFTDHERIVELLEGQALFKVARSSTRPFIVKTSDASVRAVGTEFDVYSKRTGTVVTVIEGRVAVVRDAPDRAAPGPSAVMLGAGEQLVVAPVGSAAPTPANLTVATAWTENKLIFDNTPLREVVEEFNRYNRQQLIVRDPVLYGFHVSGVFPSTDTGQVLELLRQRFGVNVSRTEEAIEISRGVEP